jgi:hypothetical protein
MVHTEQETHSAHRFKYHQKIISSVGARTFRFGSRLFGESGPGSRLFGESGSSHRFLYKQKFDGPVEK